MKKKMGDDEHCKGGNNRHTDVTAENDDDEGGEGSGTLRSQHLGLMDRK